jgi:hypothetical protein
MRRFACAGAGCGWSTRRSVGTSSAPCSCSPRLSWPGRLRWPGFGLDSLIEIVASLVVVWQLQEMQAVERELRALRIIGVAFLLLAVYIAGQSIYVLVSGVRPHHSLLGIVWLALTAVAMFALAAGKRATGRALGNRVLQMEARVTVIDGLLATAVLTGLILNAAIGWWWADPAAAFVIVYYGLREGRHALRETSSSR